MANNPYANKVEFAGQTIMDLTGDTVQPSDVLNGVTFHDRSGAPQTGSMITHNVYDGLDSTSTSDALSANQGKVLNELISNKVKITKATTRVNTTIQKGELAYLDMDGSGIPICFEFKTLHSWGNSISMLYTSNGVAKLGIYNLPNSTSTGFNGFVEVTYLTVAQ